MVSFKFSFLFFFLLLLSIFFLLLSIFFFLLSIFFLLFGILFLLFFNLRLINFLKVTLDFLMSSHQHVGEEFMTRFPLITIEWLIVKRFSVLAQAKVTFFIIPPKLKVIELFAVILCVIFFCVVIFDIFKDFSGFCFACLHEFIWDVNFDRVAVFVTVLPMDFVFHELKS